MGMHVVIDISICASATTKPISPKSSAYIRTVDLRFLPDVHFCISGPMLLNTLGKIVTAFE